MSVIFKGACASDISVFAEKMSKKLNEKHHIQINCSSLLDCISDSCGDVNWEIMKLRLDSKNNKLKKIKDTSASLGDGVDDLLSAGSSQQISNFLDLMLPGKDCNRDGIWGHRASEMAKSVLDVLCSERDMGRLSLTLNSIRDSFKLDSFISLVQRTDIDIEIKKNLKQFLAELPGYNEEDAIMDCVEPKAYEQASYLIMQFTPIFSDLESNASKIYMMTFKKSDNSSACLYLVLPKKESFPNKDALQNLRNKLKKKIKNMTEQKLNFIMPLDEMGDEYSGVGALVLSSSINHSFNKYVR